MKRGQQISRAFQNVFPLPHEVFELGLKRGALLVYIYLVYRKSLKHHTSDLSCAVISEAVGLCEKTVRAHLQTLVDKGLIEMTDNDSRLSYTLCTIQDKVRECNEVESAQINLFRTPRSRDRRYSRKQWVRFDADLLPV